MQLNQVPIPGFLSRLNHRDKHESMIQSSSINLPVLTSLPVRESRQIKKVPSVTDKDLASTPPRYRKPMHYGPEQKRDAQRQYVVIGTLAPIVIEFMCCFVVIGAAAPKGAMSC